MEKLRNGLWMGTCPKLYHKCLGEPEGKARSVDSHRFTYVHKPQRPSRLTSETHKMPTAPVAVPTRVWIILLMLFAFPIMLIPEGKDDLMVRALIEDLGGKRLWKIFFVSVTISDRAKKVLVNINYCLTWNILIFYSLKNVTRIFNSLILFGFWQL